MSINEQKNIRAGTYEEIAAYQRRKGSGGGDNEPPTGFLTVLKEKFDQATHPVRNEAKAILRPLLDHNPAVEGEIRKIASGGLGGFLAARKALSIYGPSQP